MTATELCCAPRRVLAVCAASAAQRVSDVTEVRRHVDEDRCQPCASLLFRMLAARSDRSAECGYTAKWIRPKQVARAQGRRSGAVADYEVVCGAGPFELDVLVRDCEDDRTLNFVGQVTLANRVQEPATNLAVRLIGVPQPGGAPTSTNDFGEFALAAGRSGIYGLRLGESADAPCVMVWEGWDD